jgi:hypothetical protein
MPRNFDELRKAKDLSFVLNDQVFTIHLMSLSMIGVWTEREAKIKPEDTEAFTQMCIDRVADAVDDGNGSADRWRELCASDHGPSYGELLELSRWTWEVQSDLPTMESAPSQPGRGTTAVSSKGA